MLCQLTIDQQPFSFELAGDFAWGKDEVLFERHQALFSRCGWIDAGYTVVPLLDQADWHPLQEDIEQILRHAALENGLTLPDDFQPEQYHRYVTHELHQKIIEKTRFLTYGHFALDFEKLAGKISQFIGHPLSLHNPWLPTEIIILRISRPNSLDINPPHRDGYLNLWENVVNVWIPLAGCNHYSSLPLIPGSHLWNEKDVLRTAPKGAAINGTPYHVPGIVKTSFGLPMTRPNPQPGQALLFTPFLIHGAAINTNPGQTRMALELRLYAGNA